MAQTLTVGAVALIFAQALLLAYQFSRLLPRHWGTSRIGKVTALGGWALVGWVALWLGLVLALWLVRRVWGLRPPRWAVDALNIALVGALLAILSVWNWAVWQWRRSGRRVPERQGGIED